MMSCTKVVTTVAALQLYEQGLWTLDDEVTKFLPNFQSIPGVYPEKEGSALEPMERPITMRMLLTHTSGLSYSILQTLSDGRPNPVARSYARAVDRCTTLAEMVDAVATLPLVAQPGSTWNYSMGIDVIGRIVEVLSGLPIDRYFQEYIFEPLEMSSTAFRQRLTPELEARQVRLFGADIASLIKHRSSFYQPGFGQPTMSEIPRHLGDPEKALALLPGGGLVSTLSDWVKFTMMLQSGGLGSNGARVIKASTVALLSSPQQPAGCTRGPLMKLINGHADEDASYTMGLSVATSTNGHFEWGGMTSTVFWCDPVEDIAVVCLSQLMPSAISFSSFQKPKEGSVLLSYGIPSPVKLTVCTKSFQNRLCTHFGRS